MITRTVYGCLDSNKYQIDMVSDVWKAKSYLFGPRSGMYVYDVFSANLKDSLVFLCGVIIYIDYKCFTANSD